MLDTAHQKFYITGTKRGLGQALAERYGNCGDLASCDVFINCKHDGFQQVDLLYAAAALGKRVINIGSNSPDIAKKTPHVYQVEKAALDKANDQLFYTGINTTCVRFGWFDSPRVQDVHEAKLTIDYCLSVIDWIIRQPHRIKDITVLHHDQIR